jgi:hypothetical protein
MPLPTAETRRSALRVFARPRAGRKHPDLDEQNNVHRMPLSSPDQCSLIHSIQQKLNEKLETKSGNNWKEDQTSGA